MILFGAQVITFNQFLLILKWLNENEQVNIVSLDSVAFWIQIHNLQIGFHTSNIVKGYLEMHGWEQFYRYVV